MTNLTSEANFLDYATECGLTYSEREVLKKKKWSTISVFAYTITPGDNGVAASDMIDKVTSIIIGSTIEDAIFERAPLVRKLWTDCYQLASVQMRSAHERRDSDPPVKLNAPERAARIKALKDELSSLTWDKDLEVGPNFLDNIVDMMERNALKFLPWDEMTTAEQESDGTKRDPTWELTDEGTFKCTFHPDTAVADTDDHFSLRLTLQRRALAFDLARICGYKILEQWTSRMMAAIRRKPPEGHGKVSIDQIHTADKELFRWLREQTASAGIRPDAGVRPVETLMKKVLDDRIHAVTSILAKKPIAINYEGHIVANIQGGNKRAREDEDDGAGARVAKLQRQLEATKARMQALESKRAKEKNEREQDGNGRYDTKGSRWNQWHKPKDAKGKGKHKGGGKGNDNRARQDRNSTMPYELLGQGL